MSPTTRRRALQGAVGLLGALAGCSDIGAGPDPDADEQRTATPPAREPNDRGATVPEHIALRSTARQRPRSVLSFARDAEAVPSDGGTVPESDRRHGGLIASRAVAETVTVDRDRLADSDLSASPEAVREFLDATDFETQTVYVDRWPVEECYRLELCAAGWEGDKVDTQYGRVIRPYDARCEAGVRVSRVTLIRFDAALDPDEFSGSSSGVHGDGCGGRRPPGAGDSGAMVATTSADATDEAGGPPPTDKPQGSATGSDTPERSATNGGDR